MLNATEATFWSSATLRIMDVPQLHSEIIEMLGNGTYHHKIGDIRTEIPLRVWKNSIWSIESPLPEANEVHDHLKWVSEYALENANFLLSLKARGARMDIYMSYACDDDHRGFGLDPSLLEVFVKLGIRFEISLMT